MKSFFVGAVALLTSANVSFADVTTYQCEIKSQEKHGFIQPNLIFSVDLDAGKAVVYDGVIEHYYGKPIDGKLSTNRKGDVKVKWNVEGTGDNGGKVTTKLSYDLAFNPEDRSIAMRARFIRPGAGNRPRGDGTCVVAKGKKPLF